MVEYKDKMTLLNKRIEGAEKNGFKSFILRVIYPNDIINKSGFGFIHPIGCDSFEEYVNNEDIQLQPSVYVNHLDNESPEEMMMNFTMSTGKEIIGRVDLMMKEAESSKMYNIYTDLKTNEVVKKTCI